MKKRGQLVLKPTIELVIAITVFLLFIYVGKTWGNAEVFQKARAAKETALIIDAMYASDGNSYITYPVNISKFSIKFSKDNINVYKVTPDPTAFTYYFVPLGSYALNKELIKPENLILARLGKEVQILDKEPNLNAVIYDEVSTKSTITDKKIVLDIEQGTLNDPKKLELAKLIIEALKLQIPGAYLTSSILQKGISGRQATQADLLLTIKIGSYDDQRNVIKAYYPIGGEENKKRKLASLIINQLLILNPDGANAIPTEQFISSMTSDLAVLIEIGNINSETSQDMINSKPTEIASAIYNAVKGYYR